MTRPTPSSTPRSRALLAPVTAASRRRCWPSRPTARSSPATSRAPGGWRSAPSRSPTRSATTTASAWRAARSRSSLGSCGRLDEGAELLDGLVALVEGAGREVFVPGLARVLGTLALWRGEPDDAPPLARARGRLDRRRPRARTWRRRRCRPLAAAFRRARPPRGRGARPRPARSSSARALDLPRVVAQALDEQARLRRPGRRARAAPSGARDPRRARAALAPTPAASRRSRRSPPSGGQPAHAVRLLAAAASARSSLGCPRPPVEQAEHEALLARLRETLGFDEEWAAGAALAPDEAVGYARRSRGTRDRPAVRLGEPHPRRARGRRASPSRASATRTSAPGCS